MNGRTPKEEALIDGLDDWTHAAWIYGCTRLAGITDPEQRRTLAIGVIAELIVQGLKVLGDVDDQGHHPWPQSPGDAIERITREWLTEWLDGVPTPGAIVWLANTPSGDEIARRVLAREESTS